MEQPLLVFLILLVIVNNVEQGLLVSAMVPQAEYLGVKRQLELLNKPSLHSFVTQHGDIMDCVEIDKQLSLDHPLLKNHSIQLKPNFVRLNDDNASSILTASQLLPKNMRCPKGTVLIKRIVEEDIIMMAKYSKLFEAAFSNSSFSSRSVYPNIDPPPGKQKVVSAVVTDTQNTGAAGKISIWSPSVKPDQYSAVSFFIGDDANIIFTGWMVNPSLFSNDSPRLYTYWTKDNGKSTGCYNGLCPGFIQTSQRVTLGQALSPVSTEWGLFYVDLTLKQDEKTKNWWLVFGTENVGYFPKELFSGIANGAPKAGWGGEIQSPINEPLPEMGSGHYPPNHLYPESCLLKNMKLFTLQQGFPDKKDLKYVLTKPDSYGIYYDIFPKIAVPPEGNWGNYIFVGGPNKQ